MFSIVSPPLYRTSSVSQPIYSKGYRRSAQYRQPLGDVLPPGAVVPLERNKGWIKAVANDMKEEMKNNTSNINNISNSTSNVNNFTQVINAPKQPSRLELYRQTRNLLNLVNA